VFFRNYFVHVSVCNNLNGKVTQFLRI
jgi:hypothetical protein